MIATRSHAARSHGIQLQQNMTHSELSLDLWPAKPIYLTGSFRLSSVFLPFIIGRKSEKLNILNNTLTCVQRDVGLYRRRCCLSLALQSSLRFLLPPNDPFSVKQSAGMRCMLCTRKAYPKKNDYLLHLSRNNFLPFTLPFFFRFSSGTCILYTTSVYSSVSLPFLFRGCEFRGLAVSASVYSSVSLPFLFRDHVFFKNVDSGDFVIPSLNFDRRSFIALHRDLKRLSYIIYTSVNPRISILGGK